MKKRILAGIMMLIMMLSLIPTTAIAASELAITVDTSAITEGLEPGATFTVPVNISGNTGFTNGDLKVNYDAQKLELKGFTTSNTIYSKASLKSTNKETGLVSFANFIDPDDEENFISCADNGVFIQLKFTVKNDAVAGETAISISKNPNAAAALKNNNDILNPTFVPGTITVKASTAERTVQFMNGTEAVATEIIANGEKLTNIPAAPTATNKSFLGWYAVSGSDYLLDNVDETIIGTEASTETAITADTIYQAIWASRTMLAAGFAPKDGKTEISSVSQAANLQTLVTNCNGGTVKLLQDVILPNNTYLSVASGNTLTLDLNGKTLSGNGYSDSDFNEHGVILNNGTLALISGAETRGKIALADGGQSQFGYAAVENKGLITRMEKIDVAVTTNSIGQFCYGATAFNSSGDYSDPTSVAVRKIDSCSFSATKASAFTQSYGPLGEITNSTFTGGYYVDEYENYSTVVLTNETLTLLKDCTITNNQSGGEALYIGFDSTVGSIEGCTITGPNGIGINGNGTSNTSIKNLSANITANNGYALTVKDSKAEIAITGGKYKGSAGLFNTQSNTTTITYPEGKTLLEGTDGYWALSEGYNVYFRNWDGTLLQQVSCAANGTAAYTGETPIRGTDDNCVYTFNGWNTQKDGNGTAYAGNEISDVTSDLTLYAQYSTVSARVVTLRYKSGSIGSSGEWLKDGNYASLKAAVDAMNSNDGNYNNIVITLNENAVETSTVEVKKSVTIDLNGHNLTADTAENGITVSGGATLTFKDSVGTGDFKHTATRAEKSAIFASGSGTVVNIESGTIEATKGNALKVDNAAFHVSGGTITGGNNGIYVMTQNASPVCTVSGGKIICTGNGFALNMDDAAIAGSIQLSGGAFKNMAYSTALIRNQDKCDFLGDKSLSPSPNTEGFYEVREVGTYTLVLTADEEHYNAGETVTVTVSAYGPGSINSFGFTPSYDSGKLELKSVTSANAGNFTVNQETGTSGYTVNGEGITLGGTSDNATELVTITFTAKENINDTTTITLMDLEMTPSGSATSDKAVVEKKLTVNLHDIRVTLTAANGIINSKTSETLYAKYNVADLYSDATRTTKAAVEVRAADGYRLNNKTGENLWKCGETGYASFDAIKGMKFAESKTFELQTTKVWTISFATSGVTGGSLSSTASITVDAGTKLSAAGLPKPTPSTGYAFTGWKVGTDSSTVDTNTYEVRADITLTPVFTAKSYDFTKTANQSTVTVTGGLTTDGKATYGQNITFTVTPSDGYVVESVGYQIGDQVTALTTLSPDQNGVYTIEGSKITGKVTVEVVTKAFYAVTFTVDNQQTYTLGDGNNTFYAKEGTTGLYTDQTFTARANAPAVTAADGYRLADESKHESLWYAGGTSYTTASLFGENATATFNSAVTIYAKTVKQCTITFDAGDHGALNDNTKLTVDAGTKLGAVTKPTVTPNAGYAFDKWSVADDTVVNENMTVTAMYKDGTYSISLPDSAIITVSEKTGISDANKVVHGTGVSFKLTVNHGYLVSSVSYKIGEGTATTVSKNDDGTYTINIDGAAITGDVAVTVESQQTVDVAFATDGNGSVAFAEKTVVKDSALGEDNVPTVTPNPGYQFDGWYKDDTKISNLVNEIITSAVTYTAKFTHATYSLTLSDGLTLKNRDGQSITTATHGTALIFTPTVDGKVVTGITAKIGETDVTVTENADGSYTISGDAITGNLTITAQTVDGSWSFIDKEAYKALSANTQIALLTTGQLARGNYLLGSDGMYWSSQYNAYVKIVDVNETVESLTAKLSVSTNAEALTLAYTGDINGDGKATPADGGMINDELHSVKRGYNVTEKMRLEMDVNGEAGVTTADIMTILKSYVGIN